MLTVSTPTDYASARNYVEATLRLDDAVTSTFHADTERMGAMHWDALMVDLYRAADQTWNVHLIEHDEFWSIAWAHRVDADNADRAAMVRYAMDDTAEGALGTDASQARDMLRKRWEQRRAATEHRTYAVPFDDEHMALSMTPADYDEFLALATDGDHCRPQTWTAPDGWTIDRGTARNLFDVLVLA